MSGERGHVFFGALKFLQEKISIENYAIVDRSIRTKDFFKNQKIVDLKKIYFYRDNLKGIHTPDLEYLKNFEEKHKINLCMIAYADPSFYTIDGKTNFTYFEILSLIEDDCKFFEKIIEEVHPDFLIIHMGGQKQLNLLDAISKSYGIKILKFAPAKFGKRFQISETYDLLDKLKIEPLTLNTNKEATEEYLKKIRHSLDMYSFYRHSSPWGYDLSKIRFILGSLKAFNTLRKEFKINYSNLKKQNSFIHNFTLLTNKTKKFFRKKFLDKYALYKIIPNEKFVYYTLHMQPEVTTSVFAPFFTNQISLIRNIARSLPVDYVLYVKEHPSMGIFNNWRATSYYKEILEIPNVRLVHPAVNSSLLYENCDLVVTINGSASYEALFYYKPVLVFADTSNMHLSSVFRVKNIEDLPQIIRRALELHFDTRCKNFFDSKMNESFEIDINLFNDIFKTFFIYNTSLDDITVHKMDAFLQRNEKQLNLLSKMFLKKIKQYEQNEIIR